MITPDAFVMGFGAIAGAGFRFVQQSRNTTDAITYTTDVLRQPASQSLVCEGW